jgi:hypothetical protein
MDTNFSEEHTAPIFRVKVTELKMWSDYAGKEIVTVVTHNHTRVKWNGRQQPFKGQCRAESEKVGLLNDHSEVQEDCPSSE